MERVSDDEIKEFREFLIHAQDATGEVRAVAVFDRIVAEWRHARTEIDRLRLPETSGGLLSAPEPTADDVIHVDLMQENVSLHAQLDSAKRDIERLFRFYDKAGSFVRLSTQFGGFSPTTYSPMPPFRVKALATMWREIDAARAEES